MPSLGVEDSDLQAVASRRAAVNARDNRVCVCGHPARCHTSLAPDNSERHAEAREAGMEICVQTRILCECHEFQPVIETDDPRVFRFKTRGSGAEHALSQGIFAARSPKRRKDGTMTPGGRVTFLPGWTCKFCAETEGLVAVAFRVTDGKIAGESKSSTPWNALVCQSHRMQILAES